MSRLDEKSLAQLKAFVNLIQQNTDVLHAPELKFFKDFLVGLNATIPPLNKKESPVEEVDDDYMEDVKTTPPPKPKPDQKHEPPKEKKEEKVEEVEEEDDPDPDIWAPDDGADTVELGDNSKEVTEDEENDASSAMAQGRKAARENNHELAVEKLTEAIKLNPKSAVLFATRAESFLALKRPNAAIKDCNRALELNPDSGKALKTRGKARRYLGKYAEASYDLHQGNLLDWDESTDQMIKLIKVRAEKAIVKQRKLEEKKRLDELKREAAEKRRRQQEEEDRRGREEDYGGMGGGAQGFPGGGMNVILEQLLKDPELAGILKDPVAQQKLMAYFSSGKNADDPVVKKVLDSLAKKMGNMGNMGKEAGAGGHQKTADDDLD